MGDLKPIGSEKLQGMEKINRMIEISRYKEYIPQSINENSSTEYKKVLSDGFTYQIIREKNGYVIKRGLNESKIDYIEPMKQRRYFNSYSQALKRLNLIAKEVNVNEGYDKNLSLFTESEENDERFYLKTQANEQAPAPAPAPAPEPAPEPAPAPVTPPPSSEMPSPSPETEPTDDMSGMEDMGTEPDMGDEEEVTFKTIQKLTGKLGQKIRTFLSNEENQMTSKDIKYVINSVLSALNLDSLEEEDKEEIMSKFEGGSEEMGDEEMGVEEPEMGMEDSETEMNTETPPQPEGEMGEEYDEYMSDEEQKNFMQNIFSDEGEMEESYPRHKKNGSRTMSKLKHRGMKDEEAEKVEEMIEGIFGESKVENVLKKYFKIDEKERLMLEQKNREKKTETAQTEKTRQRIKSLSENVAQEVASAKLIKKYPNAKLIGKSKNNKSLVFEIQNKTLRVTPKGSIL